MTFPHIFATQAAGNVPASYLDANFASILTSTAGDYTGTITVTIPSGTDQGVFITQNAAGTASGPQYNRVYIVTDTVDTGANFTNGFIVEHHFGGAGTKGGRESLVGFLALDAPTELTNANRNYSGVTGIGYADSDDGGTNMPADTKGALFGGGFVAQCSANGKFFANTTAAEFNSAMNTGSSVFAKSIIQLSGRDDDREHGYTIDAMIWCYAQTASTVKFTDGILFGVHNTFPFDNTSTVMRTAAGTILNGIDFSATTVAGNAFASPFFSVGGTNGLVTASGGIITSSGDTNIEIKTTGAGAGDWGLQTMATGGRFRIYDNANTREVFSVDKTTGYFSGLSGTVTSVGDTVLNVITTGAGAGSWAWQAMAADGRIRLYDVASTSEVLSIAKGAIMPTVAPSVAVGSGAVTQAFIKASSTANLGLYYGTGAPSFSAAQGSIYTCTNASSATTRVYVAATSSSWAFLTASA